METAFAGTTQECKACEKTVYLVDQLAADNKVYHKAFFRCHHFNNTLNLSNYCSFEGVLYCKPHFNQLFKLTGSFDKSFNGAPRTVSRSADQQGVGHVCRYSGALCRLQEDCLSVLKEIYRVGVDGKSYHKRCFRCKHGGCMISPSKDVAHEHRPYCKHHHNQLFKDKGNFSQLDHHEEPNA